MDGTPFSQHGMYLRQDGFVRQARIVMIESADQLFSGVRMFGHIDSFNVFALAGARNFGWAAESAMVVVIS
jgi:hypothetical protein